MLTSDWSARIDDLEHNINDLMSQAGQAGPPMVEKEKWPSRLESQTIINYSWMNIIQRDVFTLISL